MKCCWCYVIDIDCIPRYAAASSCIWTTPVISINQGRPSTFLYMCCALPLWRQDFCLHSWWNIPAIWQMGEVPCWGTIMHLSSLLAIYHLTQLDKYQGPEDLKKVLAYLADSKERIYITDKGWGCRGRRGFQSHAEGSQGRAGES